MERCPLTDGGSKRPSENTHSAQVAQKFSSGIFGFARSDVLGLFLIVIRATPHAVVARRGVVGEGKLAASIFTPLAVGAGHTLCRIATETGTMALSLCTESNVSGANCRENAPDPSARRPHWTSACGRQAVRSLGVSLSGVHQHGLDESFGARSKGSLDLAKFLSFSASPQPACPALRECGLCRTSLLSSQRPG